MPDCGTTLSLVVGAIRAAQDREAVDLQAVRAAIDRELEQLDEITRRMPELAGEMRRLRKALSALPEVLDHLEAGDVDRAVQSVMPSLARGFGPESYD